jgi:hypothetical protein
VIGKEVPDMITDEQKTLSLETPNEAKKERFWTEKRYNLFNYIGLGINLTACQILGAARSDEDYYLYKHYGKHLDGSAPHWINFWVLRLYLFQTFLLVISACFLADALRMLSKQFKKDPRLKIN